MSTVSTHVLDSGRGVPAAGVPVQLSQGDTVLARGKTDDDGRITSLTPDGVEPGVYRLWFDVAAYAPDSFFPEVTVTFTITDERHHHVPLLLSPFAYSTYRGS
jgi:5-hydroxyisourate hydrolase